MLHSTFCFLWSIWKTKCHKVKIKLNDSFTVQNVKFISQLKHGFHNRSILDLSNIHEWWEVQVYLNKGTFAKFLITVEWRREEKMELDKGSNLEWGYNLYFCGQICFLLEYAPFWFRMYSRCAANWIIFFFFFLKKYVWETNVVFRFI